MCYDLTLVLKRRYFLSNLTHSMHTAELRALLDQMGKQPNKRLGQNFLIDLSVVHSAVEAGRIKNGDVVLEVGPGLGVLTEVLLEAGANVIAIEKDRDFAVRLTSLYPESDSHLRVIEGDAGNIDWFSSDLQSQVCLPLRQEFRNIETEPHSKLPSLFHREGLGMGPDLQDCSWKFIANVPYSITSLLLRKALWNSNPPSIGIVLIQKEVAQRCLGYFKKDGDRSLLSLMMGLSCSSARIVRNVPPRCFYPSPKVDSVVFEFIPRSLKERQEKWGIDPEEVMKVAKVAFAHPRKQMASNLSGVNNLSKQDIEEILIKLELNPKIRSEELSIQNWVDLTKAVIGNR